MRSFSPAAARHRPRLKRTLVLANWKYIFIVTLYCIILIFSRMTQDPGKLYGLPGCLGVVVAVVLTSVLERIYMA